MAKATEDQMISALYAAFYDRAPELDGLNYWREEAEGVDDLDTFLELGAAFANHPGFFTIYATMGDQEFIETIYMNVSGYEGDADGIEFWVQQLTDGTSRSDVVTSMTYGFLNAELTAENFPDLTAEELATAQQRQDAVTNKADVGLWYVETLGDVTNFDSETDLTDPIAVMNDPAWAAATAAIDGVDDTQQSVEDAQEAIIAYFFTGETYDLTAGVDAITGTALNDTINGSINSNDVLATSTFSSADTIDGAAGDDTLEVTIDGINEPAFQNNPHGEDFTFIAPQVDNVETLDIRSYDAGTEFAMFDVNGLETIKETGFNSENDFYGVQNIVDLEIANSDDMYTSIMYKNGVAAGAEDEMNITIENGGDTYTNVYGGGEDAIETINISNTSDDSWWSDAEQLNVWMDSVDFNVNASDSYSNINTAETVNINITADNYSETYVSAYSTEAINIDTEDSYTEVNTNYAYVDGVTADITSNGVWNDVYLNGVDSLETVTVVGDAGYTYVDAGDEDTLTLVDASTLTGDFELDADKDAHDEALDLTIHGAQGSNDIEVDIDLDGNFVGVDDELNVPASAAVSIDTQDGDDTVDVNVDTNDSIGQAISSAEITVSTNGGMDTVDVWAEDADGLDSFDVTVNSGSEDDTVTVGAHNSEIATATINVNSGDGADTVNLVIENTTQIDTAEITVDAGADNDRVELDHSMDSFITNTMLDLDGGAGDDDTLAMDGFVAEWVEDELLAVDSDDTITNFETLAITDQADGLDIDISNFGAINLTLEGGAAGEDSVFNGLVDDSLVRIEDDFFNDVDVELNLGEDGTADTLNLVLNGLADPYPDESHDIDMNTTATITASQFETVNVTSLGLDPLDGEDVPYEVSENELNIDAYAMTSMVIDGNYALDVATVTATSMLTTLDASAATGNIDLLDVSYDETLGQVNNITTGSGDDILNASLVKDIITGGTGADTFTFNAVGESQGTVTDTITDFVSGTDMIDLRNVIDVTYLGEAEGTLQVLTALTGAAGDAVLDTLSNTLYIDVDGSETIDNSDMVIQLDGVTDLEQTDFLTA